MECSRPCFAFSPNVVVRAGTGALAILLLAATASAQRASTPVLSFGAGPAFAVGDLGSATSPGVHLRGAVGFGNTARALTWRVEFAYNRFGGTSALAGAQSSTTIISITGQLVAAVRPASPVSPFVTLGLGNYSSSQDCPGTTSALGVNGGIGLRLRRLLLETRINLAATGCNSMFYIPVTAAVTL